MKSAVYSWRLPAAEKEALDHEARREGVSMAELLSRIIQIWLAQRRQASLEEAEQVRVRAAAMRAIGTLGGGNPRRAETARQALRERLGKKHDR
jgi:hypothetical protein